jgi:hypothetical protein
MDTTTSHVHTPFVFDAGDIGWVDACLAHLVPHLGLDQAWGLWMDVYSDGDKNFYPILDEPTLVVAKDHPLWDQLQGKTGLTTLEGDLRLPALETIAALVRASGALIDTLEFWSYEVRNKHGAELRDTCYWRVLLTPQGALAIVPEDTDGHVARNTTLGLPIGGEHWEAAETIGLGSLGLPAPRSAHGALETHQKAKIACNWVGDLSHHLYVGVAEGVTWGEPGNMLHP